MRGTRGGGAVYLLARQFWFVVRAKKFLSGGRCFGFLTPPYVDLACWSHVCPMPSFYTPSPGCRNLTRRCEPGPVSLSADHTFPAALSVLLQTCIQGGHQLTDWTADEGGGRTSRVRTELCAGFRFLAVLGVTYLCECLASLGFGCSARPLDQRSRPPECLSAPEPAYRLVVSRKLCCVCNIWRTEGILQQKVPPSRCV